MLVDRSLSSPVFAPTTSHRKDSAHYLSLLDANRLSILGSFCCEYNASRVRYDTNCGVLVGERMRPHEKVRVSTFASLRVGGVPYGERGGADDRDSREMKIGKELQIDDFCASHFMRRMALVLVMLV